MPGSEAIVTACRSMNTLSVSWHGVELPLVQKIGRILFGMKRVFTRTNFGEAFPVATKHRLREVLRKKQMMLQD